MKLNTDGIPEDHAYIRTNGGFAPSTHYFLVLPEKTVEGLGGNLRLSYEIDGGVCLCIVEGGDALAFDLAKRWLKRFGNPPPLDESGVVARL